jgi:hypothetical protein
MGAQHADLTPERWARFSLDQQILMVANEMNRGAKLVTAADQPLLQDCYERVLRLVDLTVEVNSRAGLRRELLRWRDLIAALYVSPNPSAKDHRAAFRCLLGFTPAAFRQRDFLMPSPG